MIRRCTGLRLALLAALLLPAGCGLFMRPDPIGFRSYPLRGVGYDEAVDLVRDVTRRYTTERFGGVTITWDAPQGNLTVDPIYSGNRRLRLFLHLRPAGSDVELEIFALVEHLDPDEPGIVYTLPMQDVPLEETLYDALLAELLARRVGGSSP